MERYVLSGKRNTSIGLRKYYADITQTTHITQSQIDQAVLCRLVMRLILRHGGDSIILDNVTCATVSELRDMCRSKFPDASGAIVLDSVPYPEVQSMMNIRDDDVISFRKKRCRGVLEATGDRNVLKNTEDESDAEESKEDESEKEESDAEEESDEESSEEEESDAEEESDEEESDEEESDEEESYEEESDAEEESDEEGGGE